MIAERIESAAEAILSKFNVRTIPVPIEEIATHSGIRISRAPSSEFSGILIRKDGSALIGVNSNESKVRQRFTIAHELGHFFLHPRKDAFVDYRNNRDQSRRSPQERQANMFAAALIMPRKPLGKDFRAVSRRGFTDDELELLATKYEVSSEAMRFRLINLNLRLS